MTDTASAPTRSVPLAAPPRGHAPGEPGLWFFLFGDMLIFAAIFGTIVVYRAQHGSEFVAGQAELHQTYGMFNTLVLLTSSLLVVNGVRLARLRHPAAGRCLAAAMACGAVFAIVKAVEYTELLSNGHTVGSNDFYMYYFAFTGIHLTHVVIGMCALAVGIRMARPGNVSKNRIAGIEGVASFWHLVDLLWIVLFGLLYLVR